MDYLRSLTVDEIGEIGLALGLSFATLRSLSTSNYHEEMAEAWLTSKDNVAATGVPTWKLLEAQLQKMGKVEIAERIIKGKLRVYNFGTCHLLLQNSSLLKSEVHRC